MSFLKKYKKQFDDAKEKYLPDEKKEVKTEEKREETPAEPGTKDPAAFQNLTPAVPPGWTAQWDPANNRWNYHEASTGKTQTEHPDPTQYGGQSMPPGGPVLDKDGKPKKDKNGLLLGAAGGVAAGFLGKQAKKHMKKTFGGGKHGGHGGGHGDSGSSSSDSDSD